MKTQIVLSSYDAVFFRVPPNKVGKSGGVNDGSANSQRVSKLQPEPLAAGRISVCRPARHFYTGLPISLEDWLDCKEALEICQRGCDGTEDGDWLGVCLPNL